MKPVKSSNLSSFFRANFRCACTWLSLSCFDIDNRNYRVNEIRKHFMNNALKVITLVAGLNLILAARAFAGPPFLTDDPEPVDYQHWEINVFSAGGHVQGETSGAAPGLEVN